MKQILISLLMVAFYATASAALQLPYSSQSTDSIASEQPDSVVKQHILDELTVSSYNQSYKLTKGGVLTNVVGTPLSEVGTAFDLLIQLPGVRSDEGSIEVVGRGKPQIYINGRRMFDPSELHRLSSDNIRNVEVVNNPGAKYSAEVKSVILIKIVRKRGDGLSGTLQATERLARYLSQSYNVMFNYRYEGLDVFASGNFDYARRYQKQRNTMSIIANDDEYKVLSDIGIYPEGVTCLGSLGVNWEINSKQSVGARYECSATPYSKSYWRTYEEVWQNGNNTQAVDYRTYWDSRSLPTNSLNFYYSGKIKAVRVNISNDVYSQRNGSVETIEESDLLPGYSVNPFRGTSKAEYGKPKQTDLDSKVNVTT